jgi:hypothetical protein
MERLVALYSPLVTRRLKLQYRIYEAIMNCNIMSTTQCLTRVPTRRT